MPSTEAELNEAQVELGAAVDEQTRVLTERSRQASSSLIDKANATQANLLGAAISTAITSVCKAVVAELPTVSLTKVAAAMAAQSARALPNALRSRTATQYTNERGNKPATFIEVARMPTGGSGTAQDAEPIPVKFNDFFITDCQEQDAEKAEVAETFGTPHVFASGRYMRKVSIQGVCRTGPINPEVVELTTIAGVKLLSDEDYARYLVPQTLGLRVLYDKLLRASELISRGMFARLHVDGEVYSGWFTTLNIARNSNEEAFAHFTSSMLVFSRYHKDEIWAEKLVPSNLVGKRGALGDTTAAAVLSGMVGKMDLSLNKSATSIRGVITEAGTGYVFDTELTLTATGISQAVNSTITIGGEPIDGLRIAYNAGGVNVPIAGAWLPAGQYPLFPVITNYESLRSALLKLSGSSRTQETLLGTASITLEPQSSGASAKLTLVIMLDPRREIVITILKMNETVGTRLRDKADKVFVTSSYMRALVTFDAKLKGGAADEMLWKDITDTKIEVIAPDKDGKEPLVSTGGYSPSEEDTMILKNPLNKPTVTTSSILRNSDGTYQANVTFDFIELRTVMKITDLRTTNPLFASGTLQADFRLRLSPKYYAPSTSGQSSISADYTTYITTMLSSSALITYSGSSFYLRLKLNADATTYGTIETVSSAILGLIKKANVKATMSGSYQLDTVRSKAALAKATVSGINGADVTLIIPDRLFISAPSAGIFSPAVVAQKALDNLASYTLLFAPKDSAQSPTYTNRQD